MSLTNEVRKFQDDDFRAAVALLSQTGNSADAAISAIAFANTIPLTIGIESVIAANRVLNVLDGDIEAAKQLVIVTDEFRNVLGIKPSKEETNGITAQDGAENGVAR